MVVKFKVVTEPLSELSHAVVVIEIDVLIFNTSPKPFHKHVVQCPASPIHADEYFTLALRLCEERTGKLAALIGIENHRLGVQQRLLENLDT
jgi:hypothetical protein